MIGRPRSAQIKGQWVEQRIHEETQLDSYGDGENKEKKEKGQKKIFLPTE